MHIPDGFLSGPTLAVAGAVSAAALGTALFQTRNLPPRRVPLMGLSAAFVFAAQMLNFPIPGGTSGHLIGGVLTSVLLGPSAAILVLVAVLTVQCFLFADGGVLALGANVLNMGVIDSVAGYYVFRAIRSLIRGPQGLFTAVAFASWFAAVSASVVCAGELAASRTVPGRIVLPAMVHVHMVIGLGEALITTLVVFAVWQTRPDMIDDGFSRPPPDRRGFPVILPAGSPSLDPTAAPPAERADAGPPRRPHGGWEFVLFGLLIAVALALFVSPFASQAPDGLDNVSEWLGFKDRAAAVPMVHAPIADYKLPGLASTSTTWATGLAGLIGTLVAFGLALLLARLLMLRVRASDTAAAR